MSPRQPVLDLIKGDSAAHGEPHVVTPTKSKKYVSVDVDLIVHVVDEEDGIDDGNWRTEFCTCY